MSKSSLLLALGHAPECAWQAIYRGVGCEFEARRADLATMPRGPVDPMDSCSEQTPSRARMEGQLSPGLYERASV